MQLSHFIESFFQSRVRYLPKQYEKIDTSEKLGIWEALIESPLILKVDFINFSGDINGNYGLSPPAADLLFLTLEAD